MGIINRATRNLSRRSKTVACQRKKPALKKVGKCPHNIIAININDDICPACRKLIFTSDELYNI